MVKSIQRVQPDTLEFRLDHRMDALVRPADLLEHLFDLAPEVIRRAWVTKLQIQPCQRPPSASNPRHPQPLRLGNMYKEIIINVSQRETRVALLEDGTIVELFIERGDDADITGNIYKGRVQRVLPGIQAAFVDIGLHQAAFIYVDDVLRNGFRDIEKQMAQSEGYDATYPPVPTDERQSPIEELLVEGQEILVHVAKAPMGTKGPRVTSYVSLPGRFLVLMPFANHIGVSRRIEDENERLRLKNMIAEMRDNHFGYIVRTAAEGIDIPRVQQEMMFLKNLWANIQKSFRRRRPPT